jgi:hypothetical protein
MLLSVTLHVANDHMIGFAQLVWPTLRKVHQTRYGCASAESRAVAKRVR